MADIRTLRIVRPEIPQMEAAVLQRRPGLRVDQGVRSTVEWIVRDDRGRPADLTALVGDYDTGVSSQISIGGGSSLVPGGRIEVRMREPFTGGSDGTIIASGRATDPANGVIQFDLPAAAVNTHQVLLVNVAVLDDADLIVAISDGYIIVDRSLFATEYTRVGVPSVDEVKLRLRDSGVNDNYLLARIEYSLGEVAEAMCQSIALWNTVAGPNSRVFTTASFDNPDMLLDGIVGHLYEMTAHNYRRNHLSYQAAGVAVDDKANYREYDQLGQQYKDIYRKRVARTVSRNVRSAWTGTVHSPFLRNGAW